jgi:hypothetical protein
MNIDKVHLSRCIEREQGMMKAQTKRNKSALKRYQGIETAIK